MASDLDNGLRTMRLVWQESRQNICDGIFKNEGGTKIHLGKSKCKQLLKQCKAPEPRELSSSLSALLVSRLITRDRRQTTVPQTSLIILLGTQEEEEHKGSEAAREDCHLKVIWLAC